MTACLLKNEPASYAVSASLSPLLDEGVVKASPNWAFSGFV